jgi:hypothetical protein
MALNKEDFAIINQWHKLKSSLAQVKQDHKADTELEFKLRAKIKTFFEDVCEGTKNVLQLGNGYSLKMKQGYTRKVDTATVVSLAESMAQLDIPVSMLFKVRYDLDLTVYRKLTDEQKKLVDQAITLTEDAPTIELIEPKKKDQA